MFNLHSKTLKTLHFPTSPILGVVGLLISEKEMKIVHTISRKCFYFFILLKKIFTDIELIYNIVFVLGVQ